MSRVIVSELSSQQISSLSKLLTPKLTKYIPYEPTPKQTAFLLLDNREAFYGGAAGGGKSIALLMAALQYVDVPHYNAIIFRKTFSELELPEALMDVASQWLTPYKLKKEVRWSDRKKTWTFPSGAKLTFGYLDTPKDKHRYQSAAFHYIGFDEATAFTLEDYIYMFSRNRRTKYQVNVPLRVRAASNPGNIGHKWVKKRFLVDGFKNHRVFIPAIIDDNPHLDKESYIENLMELDPVTRAQLMEGNWEIEHGGLVFQKEWFPIIEELPPGYKRRIRYWDLAATKAKEYTKTGYTPSFTCGCLLSNMGDEFFIEDMQKIKSTSLEVEQLILRTAQLDGYKTDIWFEEEPGSHSKGYIEHLRTLLNGFTVRSKKETEPKLVRAQRTAADVERGKVKLLKGHWNESFLEDALLFGNPGSEKGQIDAFSGGYDKLKHYVSYSVFPTSVSSGSNSYWSGA
ncbi:MAG: phage terminase large subunit [Candidatus Heimdallarchaeaceae archaeon]